MLLRKHQLAFLDINSLHLLRRKLLEPVPLSGLRSSVMSELTLAPLLFDLEYGFINNVGEIRLLLCLLHQLIEAGGPPGHGREPAHLLVRNRRGHAFLVRA